MNGPPTDRDIRLYYFTITEAADMLEMTKESVINRIKGGKLSGVKYNGEWFVRPGAVTDYRIRRYENRLKVYRMNFAA